MSECDNKEEIASKYKSAKKEGKVLFKEAKYEISKECYLAALTCIKNYNQEIFKKKEAKIHLKLGIIKWKQGIYPQSIIDLLEGRSILESIGQFETPLGAEILTTLSILKKIQANLSEAEHYAIKAIEIMKHLNLTDHLIMAKALQNYGWILDEQAQYSKAFKILHESLDIKLKYQGEERLSELGSCYNRIGGILEHQGKVLQAQKFYLKALEYKKEYYESEDHPEVADIYNNIGNIDETLSRYTSALKNYSKFLNIYLKFHGNEHPKIADAYLNIGCIFDNLERYPQALDSYNKSLDLDVKLFGENHPRVAETLGNMGCVYLNMNNYTEALGKYRKSMGIYLKFYSPRHTKPADTYYNLGMLYSKAFDITSAKSLFLKCLFSYSETHGKEHNDFYQMKSAINRYEVLEAKNDYSYQNKLE